MDLSTASMTVEMVVTPRKLNFLASSVSNFLPIEHKGLVKGGVSIVNDYRSKIYLINIRDKPSNLTRDLLKYL